MTNRPIKIVRPWPAEQPRPPEVRKTPAAANDSRPQTTRKLSA